MIQRLQQALWNGLPQANVLSGEKVANPLAKFPQRQVCSHIWRRAMEGPWAMWELRMCEWTILGCIGWVRKNFGAIQVILLWLEHS